MQINYNIPSTVTVYTLPERLDAINADGTYADIKKHLDDNVPHLILDAGELGYISSRGIYTLLLIRKELLNRKVTIAIIGSKAFIRELLGSFNAGRDLIGHKDKNE